MDQTWSFSRCEKEKTKTVVGEPEPKTEEVLENDQRQEKPKESYEDSKSNT